MLALLHRGFSLIELLIALAIAGILLVLATPAYTAWIADSEIRNAAQSIADGMRFAQAEAIKQNDQVQFVFDKTTKTGKWAVQLVSAPGIDLRVGMFAEGASKVVFTEGPAGITTVIFTALGQTLKNPDGTEPTPANLQTIDLTSTVSGATPLRVEVGGTRTGVKICRSDAAWVAAHPNDPMGCPPVGG